MRVFVLLAGLVLASAAVASCADDAGAPDAPTAAPVASPTAATAPAIVIDEPAQGATVKVPLALSGTADVFEAVLHVQALAPNGRLLCARRVMASSGSGTRGDWKTTMSFAFPAGVDGPLPARIRAFSLSAKDGAEENIVERDVTVAPEPPDIVIVEPSCGVSVSKRAGLDVSGTADVFEAALMLELHDAQGKAVLSQNVMSAEGQTRSPFVALLDLSDPAIIPGEYDLVALSFSAMDGSRENEFAVPVTITP